MSQDDEAPPSERHTDLAHLASAIGHHVINAFAAIVSNAEILRLTAQSDNPADPSATAETIIREALHASGVARRLIDFTRPVTVVGEESVALNALADEVVEAHRQESRPGVVWRTELAPVPPVKGRAAQLRQMLHLLLVNALEAMPAAGGSITVATAVDERGWVALEVRDTGRGMRPEDQTKAVEPFFTTKAGHLGVGLSIANGIWRRHRGTLAVRSSLGEGTTVRLCVEPIKGPAGRR